jgi:hypothetical protein
MHTLEDETFLVAEGIVQFTVEGREVVAEPGITYAPLSWFLRRDVRKCLKKRTF